MGVRRNFYREGQRRHFAHHFLVADDAVQMEVHRTFYLFYTTKIMPHVKARVTKLRFVGSNSQLYYDDLHNI